MPDALKEAIRACRTARWTSLTIVITLALGTGLNAAVLALVYGILFRPLPYANADRLVLIDHEIKMDQLDAWASRLHTIEAAGAFAAATHVLRGIGPPHVVKAAFVSDNFLDVLGVAGRGVPRAAGDRQGVFVSERTARAANLPAALMIGRPVSVAGLTLPILAVLPADVSFPADGTDLWIPAASAPPVTIKGSEDARRFKLFGRMKPGVTTRQVAGETTLARDELNPVPSSPPPRGPRPPVKVLTVQDGLYGSARGMLAAFQIAAALVLLVACANVSTLLLGRGAAREQEIAVRLALGAGRGRIAASLFAEGLLLATAGSALGAGLAVAATRLLRSTAASGLPRLDAVAVDWHVLGLSLVVTVLVAMACTAAPVLSDRRTDAAALVRAYGQRGLSPRGRMTSALVVAQIALTTILLVAAGLLARSVHRLLQVDIGVDTGRSVAMRLMLADTMRLVPGREPFVSSLLDRVRELPGVQYAGIGSGLPPDHGEVEMAIRLVGDSGDRTTRMHLIAASPGYLEALGVKRLAGRTLNAGDAASDTPVVVISRSLANAFFDGRDAVGQVMPARGLGASSQPPRVIGVVDDVHYAGLDAAAGGAVYMPWNQLPLGVVSLVVRSVEDPRQVVPGIRAVLQRMDPDLAVEGVRLLDELAAHSIAERRLQITVASGFALLTLTLAILGLVSALMWSVAERRHELAIRAALGGTPRQIRQLVVRTGAGLTALGLAGGAVGALLATRLLAHALFGVTPYDPLTFAVVCGVILAAAVVACGIPARRAAGIDPATLLRSP